MDQSEDPLSIVSIKKHEKVVYIFNMSEDVWPFIAAMSNDRSRLLEIEENMYLADLRMFNFVDEDCTLFFISPTMISQEFMNYFQSLFDTKDIQILVPKKHSGVISKDILEDEQIMNALIEAANSSKRLTITSYATTLPFFDLIRELRKRGLTIYTPEAPEEEDAWTVNFYGSKAGIRQLAQQSSAEEPDFMMADGLICFGIEDAAKVAAKKYIKKGEVVIKTNKGHSGMGVLLLRPGDLPGEYAACEKEILRRLNEESYWSKFPIVIEDLIDINTSVGGGCPNVEFKIAKNGRIEFLYPCGMRITKDGVFQGIEIHNDLLSDQVATRITDTGFFVAEKYRAAGYRGNFEVDFVAGENGQIYVTESNVRTTGGTFVYETARKLFGKDFMYETYTLSNNGYDVSALNHPLFSSVFHRLEPILFDKQAREGLIIMSENLLRMNHFAYIIFGKTKKRAYEIEAKMIELLRT